MKVILISGKQGSGKTSLQKELFRTLNLDLKNNALSTNFADPLYRMHDSVLSVLELYGIKRDLKKDGPLLQLLGTDWARNTISENIWCEIMAQHIKRLRKDGYTHVIVGDCRFKNEFDYFPDAIKIRLVTPKHLRKERCEQWRENDGHASEIDLDEYVTQGKFDLLLATDIYDVKDCCKIVMKHIGQMKDE